jgi:hypothetical protein
VDGWFLSHQSALANVIYLSQDNRTDLEYQRFKKAQAMMDTIVDKEKDFTLWMYAHSTAAIQALRRGEITSQQAKETLEAQHQKYDRMQPPSPRMFFVLVRT